MVQLDAQIVLGGQQLKKSVLCLASGESGTSMTLRRRFCDVPWEHARRQFASDRRHMRVPAALAAAHAAARPSGDCKGLGNNGSRIISSVSFDTFERSRWAAVKAGGSEEREDYGGGEEKWEMPPPPWPCIQSRGATRLLP